MLPAHALETLRKALWEIRYTWRTFQETSITYDVDAIINSQQPYLEFYNVLPDCGGGRLKMNRIERDIQALGDICVSTGSCFSSMISNEGFDIVGLAHHALRNHRDTLWGRATAELESSLREFGFPENPRKRIAHYSRMDLDRIDEMMTCVEALDEKYFYGKPEESLWQSSDMDAITVDIAKRHLKKLRKRKP